MEYAESNKKAQSILDDLRRIVRVLGAFSRSAQGRVGITGAQLFVLKSLEGQRAISLNQLATRTHTHQSTVSVVVKRLAQQRLIVSTVSAADGRRLDLSLSKAGRALLRRAPPAAQEDLIAAIEQLPSKVRSRLAGDLRRLVGEMRLGEEPPPMFFEESSSETSGRARDQASRPRRG